MREQSLVISRDVAAALAERGGVVALESTVIAHGLPAPRNLQVCQSLESEVRGGGAMPATIAVIGGILRVGLSPDEMEVVAGGKGVMKLSSRELPLASARAADGATTVAATAWLAARVGISVFATGGIGGVHRGQPLDVSADLLELSRTPIIVVCAGAKSILDLPATVEALETAGVLTLGWQTDAFPSFYSVDSGLGVDHRVESATEVADIWHTARSLDTPGAILLCVPPPASHALPPERVESAIAAALAEADRQEIRGKEVTPFLLQAVARETGGRSLETNIALLHHNARVAAAVACAIAAR